MYTTIEKAVFKKGVDCQSCYYKAAVTVMVKINDHVSFYLLFYCSSMIISLVSENV